MFLEFDEMYSKKKSFKNFLKYPICISIFFILIYSPLFSYQNNSIIIKNKTNPPDITDTIYVYDTIFQYDTVYIYETVYDTVYIYDTVEIEKNTDTLLTVDSSKNKHITLNFQLKLPTFKYQPKFFAGAEISFLKSYKIYNWNNDVNSEYKQLYKESYKYLFSLSTGFYFHINYQSKIFQTGINYLQIAEKFEFYKQNLKIDTLKYYNFFQNSTFKVDTTWFVDLDSLLQGDTVYFPYLDTIYSYFKDSTLITNYDSIKNIISGKSLNLYSYFEIPLIFGYQFDFKKFSVTPKAGIILGIYTFSRGKSLDFNSTYYIINQKNINNFPFLNLSLYLSTNFKYKINPRFWIFTEPIFKYNITKSIESNYAETKFLSFGIKFGFHYQL